jgi:threonine/homoserine/homoserine lactone efflux protein
MVADLLLVGLGITLQPFPLTAFILILSSERGIMKGLAFILGWLACLVVVIAGVIVVTGGKPPAQNTSPSVAVDAIKLAVGVALILIGTRKWRRRGRPTKPPAWMARLDSLSVWAAVGLAIFLQPWTLVAAGAATVSEAELSSAQSYLALMGFCLLATGSFLALELHAVFAPAAAKARLERMRRWLDSHRDQMIVVVALLLGFWLAGKSIYLLVG